MLCFWCGSSYGLVGWLSNQTNPIILDHIKHPQQTCNVSAATYLVSSMEYITVCYSSDKILTISTTVFVSCALHEVKQQEIIVIAAMTCYSLSTLHEDDIRFNTVELDLGY